MTNNTDKQLINWWIHPDGWIYVGDEIEGARAAKQSEIDEHLATIVAPELMDE
jgi:hypothetical protein